MTREEVKDALDHGDFYMRTTASPSDMGAWAFYRWPVIKAALEFTIKHNGDLT